MPTAAPRPLLTLWLTLCLAPLIAIPGTGSAQGKRWAHADANGDGKISQAEFIAARGRIFDEIDANHDGKITAEEVAAFQGRMETVAAGAMIRHGKGGGERMAGPLKRLASLTERAPVTRAQWDALMGRRFQQLDVDHAGFITPDRMKRGAAPAADGAAPQEP